MGCISCSDTLESQEGKQAGAKPVQPAKAGVKAGANTGVNTGVKPGAKKGPVKKKGAANTGQKNVRTAKGGKSAAKGVKKPGDAPEGDEAEGEEEDNEEDQEEGDEEGQEGDHEEAQEEDQAEAHENHGSDE